MNNELQEAIKKGDLIPFLGAGASRGCTTKRGDNVLDGDSLAQHLAKVAQY